MIFLFSSFNVFSTRNRYGENDNHGGRVFFCAWQTISVLIWLHALDHNGAGDPMAICFQFATMAKIFISNKLKPLYILKKVPSAFGRELGPKQHSCPATAGLSRVYLTYLPLTAGDMHQRTDL